MCLKEHANTHKAFIVNKLENTASAMRSTLKDLCEGRMCMNDAFELIEGYLTGYHGTYFLNDV